MMKHSILMYILLVSCTMFAQVGINTTTPDPSAMLDIAASDKGMLIPRVSLTDVTESMLDGINTAAPGLLIYNTNASVTGGDGVGFYSFNGTIWEKIITSGASGIGADADFFEIGTTDPPDAITDNVYRNGDVLIGNGTALPGKLAVTQSEANQTAVTINHTSNFSGASFPTFSSLRINAAINNPGTSALSVYGMYIDTSPTTSSTGLVRATGNWLRFNGDQNSNIADQRQFLGNSSTEDIGARNDFQNTNSSAGMAHLGTHNYFYNTTSGNKGGLLNAFGASGGYGLFGNEWYGVNNNFRNDNSAISMIGLKNTFLGNAVASYGIYNDWSSASTSVAYNKYGMYTIIPSTVAGTHYGIYNDVRSTSGFAAYFLGRVSVGDSETTNYIFPTSRGTNGQIMQTDGSGSVSWVDASGLGGEDADFFAEGTTNSPANITDDIYTQGNMAIGKNTADHPLDIVASGVRGTNVLMDGTDNNLKVATRNEISNTGTGAHFGMYNLLQGSGAGIKTGVENNFLGAVNGDLIGVENSIILANGSNSDKTGTRNIVSSNGNGTHTGTRNLLSSSGTGNQYASDISIAGAGTGDFYGNRILIAGGGVNKYGSYIDIDETSAGTHYGLYSQVLKPNSYAGYFLGSVSIGTTATNTYKFPASRGTNNQVLQTDGSGNLTWIDLPSANDQWSINGNSGTNSTINFLGTTDNQDVVFRTNNDEAFRIDTDGSLRSPNSNIKWGQFSGNNVTSGFNNTLLGNYAGQSITSGAQNVLIGAQAGNNISTGNSVIAIGYLALRQYQGSFGQIAIGSSAAASTTTGVSSIAIGVDALRLNTTGGNNLAIGNYALRTGNGTANLAIGNSALTAASGFNNIAIGLGALNSLTNGNNNTVVGKEAGLRNTGSGNTIMGHFASIFTTTGNDNTVVGSQAGRNGDMGNDNVLLGASSGSQLTGSANVFLGNDSGSTLTSVSNKLVIENSATTSPLVYGEFDTDIFRINGTIQSGNPTTTGYALPAIDGTANQVMQTDGSGNVSWVDNPSASFWTRNGTTLDVANVADDIAFSSDKTSIFFPATSGTPESMIHMFDGGTNNSDRMVLSQSPAFSNWGLMYRDSNDSFRFLSNGNDRVVINLQGAGNPLVVNGIAQATSFQSATTTYPDYVFESYFEGVSEINPEYSFKTLDEIFAFIKANGHLPGVKSFDEVEAEGMQVNLTETTINNLEKIEELYLYAYELQQENQQLKSNQIELEERLERLEKLLLKE